MFLWSEIESNGSIVSAVHKLVVMQLIRLRSCPRGLRSTHNPSYLLNASDESITASIFRQGLTWWLLYLLYGRLKTAPKWNCRIWICGAWYLASRNGVLSSYPRQHTDNLPRDEVHLYSSPLCLYTYSLYVGGIWVCFIPLNCSELGDFVHENNSQNQL